MVVMECALSYSIGKRVARAHIAEAVAVRGLLWEGGGEVNFAQQIFRPL